MGNVKISIIVPVWNAADTLNACIESVVAQTFREWELLLSDDGSEDDSLAICRAAALKDERIKVIENSHKGVAYARNKALDKACGEYVCFVDADDTVDNEYIETLYSHSKADMVVCGYWVDVYGADDSLKKRTSHVQTECFYDFVDKAQMKNLFLSGMMHINCNKLLRKDIIDNFNLRYKPYIVNEDFIFMMEYLLHCKNLYVVAKATYHWIRVDNVQSGVESLPENTLGIYNQAHDLLRQFFACNIRIADEIMFFSYELVALKCLRLIQGEDKTKSMLAEQVLVELMRNEKVKASYKAYKPVSFVDNVQHRLLMSQHYKVYRLLKQLCAFAGKLIEWGKR